MLRDELTAAMKAAMRAKETHKLSTIRLILAAVKEKDIDNRTEDSETINDDGMIIDILAKMVKQRGDSIKAYEEGGRCELAEQERREIEVIKEFLPRQLSTEEVENAAKKVIQDLGAAGLKDIGRCMASLKSDFAGQMDMALASKTVKALLS